MPQAVARISVQRRANWRFGIVRIWENGTAQIKQVYGPRAISSVSQSSIRINTDAKIRIFSFCPPDDHWATSWRSGIREALFGATDGNRTANSLFRDQTRIGVSEASEQEVLSGDLSAAECGPREGSCSRGLSCHSG